MHTLRPSTVVEALACWGEHEAAGRLRGQVTLAPGDSMAAADLALRYRAPLISHILSHHPRGAVLVELEPNDLDVCFLADGRTFEQWIAQASGEDLSHFEKLRDATVPPVGPLVAAIHESGPTPIVVYDGWHRGSAWFERCRSGRPSSISAHVFLWTKH